jgi:hypothetical protein
VGNCPFGHSLNTPLLDVKDEIIEEKDELLELENDSTILVSIAKAIKLVNMTWNMPQEKDSKDDDTASYIDVAVIRYKHDDYYLLVKQSINIVNCITKIKASICCGILSLKLSRTKSSACNEQVLLSNGEFCIKKTKLLEHFKVTFFLKTLYSLFLSSIFYKLNLLKS